MRINTTAPVYHLKKVHIIFIGVIKNKELEDDNNVEL